MFRTKDGTLVNPTLFESIYLLAKSTNRNKAREEYLLNNSFNIDVKKDGITPVSKLASEGNHQGVELLLSYGADAKYAVEGYKSAGYFDNAEKAKPIFASINDPKIRDWIARKAKKTISFDIQDALNTNQAACKK